MIKYAIEPAFDEADSFHEGLAAVKVEDKWGYIDKSGGFTVKPCFESAESFSEGMAPVEMDGLWGYIKPTGKFALQPQYTKAKAFAGGIAPVREDDHGRFGFIDKNGEYTIDLSFLVPECYKVFADPFVGKLAKIWVRMNDSQEARYGFVNRTGLIVAQPNYYKIHDISEGFIRVRPNAIGYNYGFLNENGFIHVKPQFDAAWDYSEGLAAVSSDGRMWGYIDTEGRFAIDCKYAHTSPFSEGLALVALRDHPSTETACIDKTERIVFQGSYERTADKFSEGLLAVMGEKGWGFVDRNGALVIQPTFNWVSQFMQGVAEVSISRNVKLKNGSDYNTTFYGMIDKSGTYLIEPALGSINNFSEGLAAVEVDEKWGYITHPTAPTQ